MQEENMPHRSDPRTHHRRSGPRTLALMVCDRLGEQEVTTAVC